MTTTTSTAASLITDAMRQQYREEGYFILERALPEEHLALLRGVAQDAVDVMDARMDAEGVDQIGINSRGRRYFTNMLSHERTELREVLFSSLMADICQATIGDEAHLFWEQFVIKGADPDTKFAWHQDSGYVHEDANAYVTLWIALDDVTEENGSVYLLPYSRSGIRSYIKHIRDPRTNDEVCYFGSDPGMPVIVPAGTVVVFSSMVIHRSGPNLTDQMRRVYLAQYSGEVIMHKDGVTPWGESEQFLADGAVVAN
jgi:ectoine hydroxylase-related dioxygenase (phytanoyl-CoA dioxygenase family)